MYQTHDYIQPIYKRIALVTLLFVTFISCSKDKEEETSTAKIETSKVTEITFRSAKSGGIITESNSAILQRGICYDSTPNPDISSNITKGGFELGSFTSNLGQLSANTKYYVRAYMVNSSGTFYGNQIEFTTSDYPKENIWTLNENTYAINEQNLIAKLQWVAKDSTFIGIDNGQNDANLIVVKFKEKPSSTKSYKLVNKNEKNETLADDECVLKVLSARAPYVGTYNYASATPHTIQVVVENNKSKITIPTVDIYEENDISLSQPIQFRTILLEK